MDEYQAEMLRRLRYMFDLPEGSTPQDVLAHLQKVLDYLGGSRAAGAAPLSLMSVLESRDQQITALTAQLAAASAAQAGMVPLSALLELQQQHAALSAAQAVDSLKARVTAALSDGRLLPSMSAWADAQLSGTADQRAALSAYLDAAVPLPALAGSQTAALAAAGGAGGAGAGGQMAALTANEIAVCDALGIDHAAYSAQKTGGVK